MADNRFSCYCLVMQEKNTEIRDFSYISGVFKYIEGYHKMGHQIGRKIGDMLELIVLAKIYADKNLTDRLMVEPKIYGETGAGHKVEFGFFEDFDSNHLNPFGIIECKKVGVEVTKNASIKNSLLKLGVGEEIFNQTSPSWYNLDEKAFIKLVVKEIHKDSVNVTVESNLVKETLLTIDTTGTFKLVITEDCIVHALTPDTDLREIDGIVRFCRIIKLEKIDIAQTHWGIYDCLTGPQTIEKAKQASLVAMDARKLVDGKWGKDDLQEEEKSLLSILVLTESSHWEIKSRKVITTCIDHNIIVPDDIVVEAFKMFEERFGLAEILPLITKNKYIADERVRLVIDELVAKNRDKLFYDLDLGSYVDFKYENGKLKVFNVS